MSVAPPLQAPRRRYWACLSAVALGHALMFFGLVTWSAIRTPALAHSAQSGGLVNVHLVAMPGRASPAPARPAQPPKRTQLSAPPSERISATAQQQAAASPPAQQEPEASPPNHAVEAKGASARTEQAAAAPPTLDLSAASESRTLDQLACRVPRPDYPPRAARLRQQGSVKLEVLIAADGRVAGVTLLQSSGFPALDGAASEAIAQARCQSRDHAAKAVQSIHFNLPP